MGSTTTEIFCLSKFNRAQNSRVPTNFSQPPAATISTDAKQFQDNNDFAFEGSDIKFTCSYTNPAGANAPTVTWTATATKGGTAIATGTPDNSAAASSPVSHVILSFCHEVVSLSLYLESYINAEIIDFS